MTTVGELENLVQAAARNCGHVVSVAFRAGHWDLLVMNGDTTRDLRQVSIWQVEERLREMARPTVTFTLTFDREMLEFALHGPRLGSAYDLIFDKLREAMKGVQS